MTPGPPGPTRPLGPPRPMRPLGPPEPSVPQDRIDPRDHQDISIVSLCSTYLLNNENYSTCFLTTCFYRRV